MHDVSRKPCGRAASICKCLIFFAALSLASCGGGGSGSGSGSGGSQGVASLSASTATLSAQAVTSEGGGAVLADPVNFSISGISGSYYYELSYIGTAIGATGVAINGQSSVDKNSGNSTLGATPALAYAIGGTINGSWSGPSLGINSLSLLNAAVLGAGVYHDSITLRVCMDAGCTQQIAGSPLTIPVTYTVTGSAVPDAQVTVNPDTQVEFPSTQTAPADGSIIVQGSSLPPTGAYVFTGASKSGLIAGTTFTSTLAPSDGVTASGNINFSLTAPETAGVGIHTVDFPIDVCFDTSCNIAAQGSPWTENITYIVDPVAGHDFTQQTLALSVSGMVWDAQTDMLYAITHGYSQLDPNMLVEIDPTAGTVVNAVTLDGGVGQIEPGTLAISSDDQYLYVAVSDAARTTDHIDRVRTNDLGLDLAISLPAYTLTSAIASAPGAPHTLAVLTGGSAPQLAIYDDATVRSATLSGQNGQSLLAFTWGADATSIYVDFGGSSDSVAEAAVTSSGLQLSHTYSSSSLASIAIPNDEMNFVNGLIMWDSGETFDPSSFTLSTPFNVDTSPTPSSSFDAALGRAYFVSTDQPSNGTSQVTSIEGFNLTTRAALWIARFSGQNPLAELTRWGSGGLAFDDNNGGTDSLVLISGSFIAQ